jgi:hypothetical protein
MWCGFPTHRLTALTPRTVRTRDDLAVTGPALNVTTVIRQEETLLIHVEGEQRRSEEVFESRNRGDEENGCCDEAAHQRHDGHEYQGSEGRRKKIQAEPKTNGDQRCEANAADEILRG